MLQMSDVREGGRFLGVGGFWVVGLIGPPISKRKTVVLFSTYPIVTACSATWFSINLRPSA